MYTLIVLLPLIGALFAGLLPRYVGQKLAMIVPTLLVIVAALLSIKAFLTDHTALTVYPIMSWIHIGSLHIDWSVRVDTLSRVMLVVVTFVSSLVHIYSLSYMSHDRTPPKFMSFISFFTFMMLSLVTANNFVQLFFGWEGVGVASYLLIGYWFHKESACNASIKAFVVNRVGDLSLILALALIYKTFGSLEFAPVFEQLAAKSKETVTFLGYSFNTLDLIGYTLFFGAMGKSAQIFLHTWLADAMEGPTPVSALIHAATMVTAGVFLLSRCSFLYHYTPDVLTFVTFIGATTALFAATMGLAQNDIKRIIAYSTCSQLGYMFFAAGLGAFNAAMFHLFTHAFFKALLFLGAGSVIHALHDEQDIRKMGGMASVIKQTFALCLIGTLAITGFGIPGLGGFAGFYSKDMIIETAMMHHGAMAAYALFAGLFGAFMTAYYSWRLVWKVYFGQYRGDHHTYEHAHESGPLMLIPMYVLGVAAIAAGFIFAPSFVGHDAKEFWAGSIWLDDNAGKHPPLTTLQLWSPFIVSMLGLVLSYLFLMRAPRIGEALVKVGKPLHTLFLNKYYFDEIYQAIFVKPYTCVAGLISKVIDKCIIDGLYSRATVAVATAGARVSSCLQSGFVYHYMLAMFLGVVVVIAFFLSGGI